MKYKKTDVNIKPEKDIIAGMILNTQFLKEIIPILKIDLLKLTYAKTVSLWCTSYFQKYNEAPKKNIQEIFESQKREILDETQAEMIYEFLDIILDENINNTDYAIDKAIQYLKKRKLEQLKENISASLLNEDTLKAESFISNFSRVEKPHGEGIDILDDKEAIENAMDDNKEYLFSFPGILGKVLGSFSRGDLIMVAAPIKRGKTWWLQYIGLRGLFSRLKVLFVSLEMSESQMIRRLYQSLTGSSARKEKEIEIPFFDGDEIGFKTVIKKPLSLKKIHKKRKAIQKMIKSNQFRLLCFPAYSANVSDLKLHLDNLEHYENFIPDVIIVDYADILAIEKNVMKEHRQQINSSWQSLRSLAQEKHCLVVTASHTNKESFKKDINQGSVTEDIRKLAHIAQGIALNQSKEDKKNHIMRINALVNRHDEFDENVEVEVLYNYNIGKVYIDSRIKKEG